MMSDDNSTGVSFVVSDGREPFARQFLIEYDWKRCVLLIDKVEVSVKVLHGFVVEPQSNLWFRFTRSGNTVTVETKPVE